MLFRSKIDNAAITSNKIATGAITAGKIDTGVITGTNIATGTITASNIQTGTITSAQIATATITASNIGLSTITADRIANQTITGGKIDNLTITGGNIANATIDNIKINNIEAGKLTAGTITATVSLQSPKIAVAGSCYNASSYTNNTFASTTLRQDDDGTTKPSGFGGGSYSYVTMPGATLYGWGHGSGAFGTRYGRSDPKISVFSSAEFSNIASGNYASYVIEYTINGGSSWSQVTPIDSSVYNPNTFVSSSGAVELSGLSDTGTIEFRFRFNGASGGNPTCEYCQIQVVCYNF